MSRHQSGQATPFPVPGQNASVSRDAAYLFRSEAVGAGLARTRKSTCYMANRDASSKGLPLPFPPPTVPRHTRPGTHHVQNSPASFAHDPTLANTIPTPVSLAHLVQALPHYAVEDVVHIHERTLHSAPERRRPFNTSSGPSHCNVIVTTDGVSLDSLLELAPQISRFISGLNPSLIAKSPHLGYGGLTISTTQVITSPELSQVETFVRGIVPEGTAVKCEIPSSRSFCKLINILFINASGNHLTPADAERFLLNSVHKDNIRLAASPRIVRDSRTADSCTIYFNIWDSQKGS